MKQKISVTLFLFLYLSRPARTKHACFHLVVNAKIENPIKGKFSKARSSWRVAGVAKLQQTIDMFALEFAHDTMKSVRESLGTRWVDQIVSFIHYAMAWQRSLFSSLNLKYYQLSLELNSQEKT